MKKTLYLKFLLAYLIFGIFGLVMLATFVPSMTMEHLIRDNANSLYSEATLIANTYARNLYKSEISLEAVKDQLDALALYLNSSIQIINPSGRLVLDTDRPIDVENEIIIETFDATVTGTSYYVIDNFFGVYPQDVLSVIAPITSNYMVKGYVVIHMDMSSINESCNSLLTISYITLIILFLLSLIILIFLRRLYICPCERSPMPQNNTQPAICTMNFPLTAKMKWDTWPPACLIWPVKLPAQRTIKRNLWPMCPMISAPPDLHSRLFGSHARRHHSAGAA